MKLFETIYWKIPVFIQKATGIWPFSNGRSENLKRVLVFFSASMMLIPSILEFCKELGKNVQIMLECTVAIMFSFAVIAKYFMSIINMNKHKRLYEMISNEWDQTTDEDEKEIIKLYARNGGTGGIYYHVAAAIVSSVFFYLPVLNPIFDYFMPLENGTRPLILPYYAEFLIDQEKYYYYIIIEMTITGFIAVVVMANYDVSFVISVQHICSSFAIINFRLQRIPELTSKAEKELETSMNHKNKATIESFIVKIIQLHQTVIENIQVVEDAYSITWLVVLFLNSTVIGISMFVLLIKINLYQELLRQGLFFVMVLVHQYYIFSGGQTLIDSSINIIDNCYSCEWYDLSPKNKTLIKIMMARCTRPLYLTGGKMFNLSMDTYSQMLKSGMSFFTMLANTWEN